MRNLLHHTLPESLEEAAIIDGASPRRLPLNIVHILTKIMVMIKVSTAELKSRLGTYLGMVRAGATIDITSYRQSVARLVPAVEEELLIDDPTEPPEALARLDRLPSGRSIPGLAALLADRRRR